MSYLPKLIPEKSKVLPEYFKQKSEGAKIKAEKQHLLFSIAGALFIVLACYFIKHPLVFLLFGFLAYMSFPFGKKWLEAKLSFKLTPAITLGTYLLFILGLVPMISYYQGVDKEEFRLALIKEKAEQQARHLAQVKETLRKDSLQLFLSAAEHTVNNTETAKSQLKKASRFLLTDSETVRYAKLERTIIGSAASRYFKAKQYKKALGEYATLISFDNADREVYYQRAYCYYKLGNVKRAVADLTHSKNMGYESATKLYNRVNPLKKRIAYYVTRCCDGSTSDAKGRGACSWHGGVCNWNDAVYEEYRKY